MCTGREPVLSRLSCTVCGSSRVRKMPKSIISTGEYIPGAARKIPKTVLKVDGKFERMLTKINVAKCYNLT